MFSKGATNFDSQDGESLIERKEQNRSHRLKLVTAAKEVPLCCCFLFVVVCGICCCFYLLLLFVVFVVFFIFCYLWYFYYCCFDSVKLPNVHTIRRFKVLEKYFKVLEKHGNLAVPAAILLLLVVKAPSSISPSSYFLKLKYQ